MTLIPSTAALYSQYRHYLQKIADIRYAAAVLQWDQETVMPLEGSSCRARQLATLSEISHEMFTSDKMGNLLKELGSKNDLSPKEKSNIELSLYDYNRQKKLPSSFVHTLSEAISQSFQSWLKARKENAFAVFEKDLDRIIHLKKQETDYLGFEGHPYDALLNEYERGCTVAMLDRSFIDLQEPLRELLHKIENREQVDDTFLLQHFPKQQQWDYSMQLIRQLGFDFEAGRQDLSEHPFTTSFSNKDVRITTRINENDFGNMTWSCMHELGHALYEQGLPGEEYGLPLGEYASLSIHESQARLWENNVGRSLPFWKYHFTLLHDFFPQQFARITPAHFHKGINKVQSSLIRTEADEITYHFHVIIRYELEKLLLEGTIGTREIPAAWNELYQRYLGVKVPDDKSGCLQDVHWSHGSFGYFPTYSLGSLYAAQLYSTAEKQLPSLEEDIAGGRTNTLLNWLRAGIHAQGRKFTSAELCENITGEPLNSKYFVYYIVTKFSGIYDLGE